MTTEPTPAGSHTGAAEAPEPAAALPRRKASDVRRWLAFGSGVGIEMRDGDLHAVIARVRPSGATVLGALTIPDFRNRPAAEWGVIVTEFLRRNAAGHIAATVLLPRHDVIVRQVNLPGVGERDLQSAIRLQIDSLHPFSEDEVYYSWARLGSTSSVLVGIVRREVLDGYAALMAEAGVKVSAFTFSAAVLYSAIRLTAVPPPEFLLTHPGTASVEVYGESAARPLYSATLPVGPDRAAALGRSELRIDPDTGAHSLAGMLPAPAETPKRLEAGSELFAGYLMPYATALAGACPWLAIDGNLLPADRRRASSRMRLIPTFTLAAILACFLILLALQSAWADSRYLGVLQHEIRRYEPAARRVDALDKSIVAVRNRSQSLDDFRRRAKLDMDTLAEVTRLIEPPGWVSGLEMDRNTVQLAGESDQAAPLLEAFDKSPLLARSEFTMPITRSGTGEMFRIRTSRENPPAGVPAAPAARPENGAK
jgi:hypothetical protein